VPELVADDVFEVEGEVVGAVGPGGGYVFDAGDEHEVGAGVGADQPPGFTHHDRLTLRR